MVAHVRKDSFNDDDWIFEIKWDGYRAIADISKDEIKLYSRNGISFHGDYPGIYEALKSVKKNVVLDGEIVAIDEHGKPSFQLLQRYLNSEAVPLCYYVFDVLYIDGKSVESKPLLERKALLQSLLPKNDFIRYCDHVAGQGKAFFSLMQKQGLEGMMAKRADSTYREGARSWDWLKIKHMIEEEAVIAGFTKGRNSRKYFGALILGAYKKGKLIYIGHTGTGFTDKSLKYVYDLMKPIITDESPFEEKIKVNAPVTWVKPKLICNLKFTEVTDEGSRRHPVFLGLREDKAPKEVQADPIIEQTENMEKKTETTAKSASKFTHLEKVYWPDEGYTKGDLIDYYDRMYKYVLKYIKDRPLSLLRNPNGIKEQGFFQKDAGEHVPDWVKTEKIWSESNSKHIDYHICNDKKTLLYLANLGCIEMNPWFSRIQHLENPDYLVLDLDPSPKNTYDQVVETANVIKEILDKAGAACYCKTSGATGLHVYVPLGAKYDYDHAKSFAELIAMHAQEQLPDFTSLERSLKKRGDNIYIDYLQNRTGQTLACAYSLRPKPGAPVSTPLGWAEVKKGLDPLKFNIKTIQKRVEQKGDLFAPVLGKGIDMQKCLKKLNG